MSRTIPIPQRFAQDCLAMAGLIFVLDWLSLQFARGPSELAAIWFGNGVLCGWLLSRRTESWLYYAVPAFVAEVVARLLVDGSPVFSTLIPLCNLAESLTIATAIRKRVPSISDPRHWLRLGGIATVSTLLA